jgi:monoamine oxidase
VVRGRNKRPFPARRVLTSLGHALRRPTGRIHWAGTETAPRWFGFIEGAVRSGERAAEEVSGSG